MRAGGGDQFLILLDGLKEVGHATVAADRILAELLTPFALSGRQALLSASIGIAVSATGYSRVEDVLRDAETALHRATQLGGARCEAFDTAVLRSAHVELQLETDFTGALDRQEFQLVYQAILSLGSNQIVGFEALVRWQHPVLGLISPVEFVPIAERSGFIEPLGLWILREACLQLKAWQDGLSAPNDLWVSVNLSSLQFRNPGLVDQIGDILREAALDARCLRLELTESIAMEDPTAVKSLLMRLQAMGVRISIDDFGTGRSSLAYLRQFPVDGLKIDQSFVRGIEKNQDMADIFGTVTAMARKLGLYVVAEGIENEDQLDLVRSLHCEYGQGYFFSRPLDRDKAAALLSAGLPPPQRDAIEGAAEPQHRVRRLWTTKWLYAAAAALAVVISAGLPGRPTPGLGPPPQMASLPAVERGGPLAGTPGSDTPLPIPAAADTRPTPAPAAAEPPRSRATATAPAPSPAPPAGNPAPPAGNTVTSLRVVHQHRLGSCRGLLVVSRNGVAFSPDEKSDQAWDGFSLKYDQFLHVLDRDSLTIKSHDRTYRFKAAVAKGEDGDELERFVASLTRFR